MTIWTVVDVCGEGGSPEERDPPARGLPRGDLLSLRREGLCEYGRHLRPASGEAADRDEHGAEAREEGIPHPRALQRDEADRERREAREVGRFEASSDLGVPLHD